MALPGTGWKSRRAKAETSTATVLSEVRKRRLNSVEKCQQVWVHEQDPLAVCVALVLSDLPEWLLDAALAMLVAHDDDESKNAQRTRQLWRRSKSARRERIRAEIFAQLRELPGRSTRGDLEREAVEWIAQHYDERTSPAVIRRAFNIVSKTLRTNPHRYHLTGPFFDVRLREALDRLSK